MYTGHLDAFNDAINAHGLSASWEDHDNVLYHEGKLYDIANEYLEHADDFTMIEVDRCLRYMRWHIDSINAYTCARISTDCVMFELLDVQSMRRARA